MSVGSHALIDLAFSWSINDVLNDDLYKDKVRTIPYVFPSETEYLNAFVAPLIEETHADLLASFTTLSNASSLEIESIKKSRDYNLPKDTLYEIDLKRELKDERDTTGYEPEVGDLIAISSVRPQCVSDLDRPERTYVTAYVKRVREGNDHFELLILSSKPILVEDGREEDSVRALFAVKLTNLTTNIRIWNSLHSDPELANRAIIHNVLPTDFLDAENCAICNSREKYGSIPSNVRARIRFSDLNESQRDAVLSCIETRECHHLNTVKMVWGPPGTGKTKTVGFLLNLLLMMQCRTLTCTPTNTAVVQVTKRLMEKVKESAECDTYGLGDIVLFGNRKRMKIDDFDELHDVFLEHRVDMLNKCLHPKNGWKDSLQTMIGLLKEPETQYRSYLRMMKGKSCENNDDNEENCLTFGNEDIKRNREKSDESNKTAKCEKNKKRWKQVITQMIKENRKKFTPKEKKAKFGDENVLNGMCIPEEKIHVTPMTFEKFVKKSFNSVGERLYFFAMNLCTHLPTAVISLEVVKNMLAAVESLESFEPFLNDIPDEDLREAYSRGSRFTNFNVARVNSLYLLESLPFTFPVPWSPDRRLIREFCLEKACLIFCTVSGSAKLHIIDMAPLELLVIDEAAQLKECESTIPLQLPGVRHAILVGDERQLPAMVRSKISEAAQFGRSLYERLAFLDHKKHLLNVQYRMHPSISLFPNREFYRNQILDGQNVRDKSYNKHYLWGKLYSSYSFINVSYGKEEFDDKRSRKNIVEVAVVAEIIASLRRASFNTRKKVRVGVISPYKAQVHAITEKVAKYTTDVHSDFGVSVRTVDGFQGGEEDVIIISAVRCNGIGSISFLASRQRANVALTRARYCLWIVGSGTTLNNSNTFWKRLVADAKERGCFHDAAEDKNLARAITVALVEDDRVSALLNLDSLLFKEARWKVHIADSFWRSMTRLGNNMLCKKVLDVLERLSNSLIQPDIRSDQVAHSGASSQLVDCYMVNTQQYLVCTVDIIKENSHYIQIFKVWDILPLSNIPDLSNKLHTLYGSYSSDKMSRCKYKCYDGDFLVPMRWPVDSNHTKSNPGQLLSKLMFSVSLTDRLETPSTNERNLVLPMREREQEQSSRPEIVPVRPVTKSGDYFSLIHEPITSSTTNMSVASPRGEPEVSLTPKRNLVDQQRLPLDPTSKEAEFIEELSELFASLSLRDGNDQK